MFKRRDLASFSVSFIVLYELLIFPWPHWNQLYSRYLRMIETSFMEEHSARRIVRFEARQDTPLDTNIVLANPNTADPSGNMQARILALDSRGIGWIPTALTLALIVSTPLPLQRRLSRAVIGFILVQTFIIFTLWVYLANESLDFFSSSRSNHPRLLFEFGNLLETTLVTQLGASIIVPVVIWSIISFRKSDWETIVAPLKQSSLPNPPRICQRD